MVESPLICELWVYIWTRARVCVWVCVNSIQITEKEIVLGKKQKNTTKHLLHAEFLWPIYRWIFLNLDSLYFGNDLASIIHASGGRQVWIPLFFYFHSFHSPFSFLFFSYSGRVGVCVCCLSDIPSDHASLVGNSRRVLEHWKVKVARPQRPLEHLHLRRLLVPTNTHTHTHTHTHKKALTQIRNTSFEIPPPPPTLLFLLFFIFLSLSPILTKEVTHPTRAWIHLVLPRFWP